MNKYTEILKSKIGLFLRESLEAPLYVEYLSQKSDEVPFEKQGKKWEFVWAKYPDGKRDIGVYSFSEDLVYAYTLWRKMVGIDKDGENVGASMYDRHFKSDLKEEIPLTLDDVESDELDFADEATEPDYENDAFIQDVVSGGYDVSISGKHIGHYEDMNVALYNLKKETERSNYFPTTWFVSDHGNYWPIDENGNEIKNDLQERISPTLFKSAINVSKERGTDNRTRKLGTLYFNNFIGKPLRGGIIKDISIGAPQQGNYRQIIIQIEHSFSNAEVVPDSLKNDFIYYDIDKDYYDGDAVNIAMDRKDARILSLIALKINPQSRYKETGKYFNIKGMNENTISENIEENLKGIEYLKYIFNNSQVEHMKFYYGSKSRMISNIGDNGIIVDKPIFGLTLKDNFIPYNFLMDKWGDIWSFTVKIQGNEDEIMLEDFDFTEEEKNKFPQEDTPADMAQSDFEDVTTDDERELNENSERNKEIASTIINQLGGFGKLRAMTGADTFIALDNGVSFKIKNRSANYIKIILNGKDLYDVEIGRISGSNYKIVKQQDDVYFDELKKFIENATGMYLSLFENKLSIKYLIKNQISEERNIKTN